MLLDLKFSRSHRKGVPEDWIWVSEYWKVCPGRQQRGRPSVTGKKDYRSRKGQGCLGVNMWNIHSENVFEKCSYVRQSNLTHASFYRAQVSKPIKHHIVLAPSGSLQNMAVVLPLAASVPLRCDVEAFSTKS